MYASEDPTDYLESEAYSDAEGGAISDYSPRRRSARASSPLDGPSNQGRNNIISVDTSFDAYFLQHAKPPRTSANVFSQLVPPLSADEYAAAIEDKTFSPLPELAHFSEAVEEIHRQQFPRFRRELDEGFNLLFYGFGSKRKLLNAFIMDHCRKHGHVVVVNGHQPHFALKDMISAIEQIPGIAKLPLTSQGLDSQLKRICDFFTSDPPSNSRTPSRPLYLLIHNLDAPPFRTPRAKALLAPLLTSPRIRIAASLDHIHAPHLWSTSDLAAHRWLWHDLTTLAPYAAELAFADHAALRGAPAHAAAAAGAAQVTESAAQHVLASVTVKAKKLFALLGAHALDAAGEGAQEQDGALAYDRLFALARDNFVATNDTALRALLGEFRDHGLVVVAPPSTVGGAEMLWIPVRRERLKRILEWLEAQ